MTNELDDVIETPTGHGVLTPPWHRRGDVTHAEVLAFFAASDGLIAARKRALWTENRAVELWQARYPAADDLPALWQAVRGDARARILIDTWIADYRHLAVLEEAAEAAGYLAADERTVWLDADGDVVLPLPDGTVFVLSRRLQFGSGGQD